MKIPVEYRKEREFDKAIAGGRFCKIVRDNPLPQDYLNSQNKLNHKLETRLIKKYGEARVFVSLDVWATKHFHVYITSNILDKNLILLLLSFLQHHAEE